MPPEVSARDFLATLWGKNTSGVAELTVIKKGGSIQSWPWTYPGSMDNLIGAAERHNSALRQGDSGIYVGVCLRREAWPRQNKAGEIEKRGTEENALLTNVIWADIDFTGLGHKGKVVDPAQAKKLMHECPCKPSIVVLTGGGIQVYWMLKEPATGDDLWRVKAINVALKTYFGGDPTGDLARIFRLPGSTNPKYPAMPKAKVSYWHPENAYLLDDFDVLNPDVEAVKPGSAVVIHSTPGTPGTPDGSHHPRLAPGSVMLSESSVDLIKKHLADIWLSGWRHRMALYVGGLFAHAGVSLEQAADIVACVSSFVKGDTKGRVKDVEDTYRRFSSEKKIAGATAIEKMIKEEFPAALNTNAKKIFEIVRRAVPKPPKNGDGEGERKGADPDFDVVKVIKYTSSPARYVVTLKVHENGSMVEVPCANTEICQKINKFRTAFFEATPVGSIAMVKQRTWEALLKGSAYEEREAPPEATMAGSIGFELETFMDERKEKPELGELRSYPGYDEEKLYFSFNTFKGRLRDNGVRPNDQELTDVLKGLGWDSKRIRMGVHTRRLWWKAVTDDEDGNGNANGNGNGNGHGPQPEPESQSSLPFEEPVPAPPVEEPNPEETSGSDIDPENPF